MAHNGVEGHREGVGQHGGRVGDAVGHGDEHGVVRRQPLRPRAGRGRDDADVDPGAEVPLGEAPAQAEVAGRARRAEGIDAAGRTRQPGIEDDALADVEPARLGPEGDDLGHHLVAGHVGERRERRHGVVDVARVEVTQHELGVGAADARQDRAGDHPVRPRQARVVDLVQPEGDRREHLLQFVLGRRACLVGRGRGPEDQRLHEPAWSFSARIPTMKASMSAVLASITAFMSGR